jgi:peptidoglycan hydrolase CwlO-like protein
MRKDMLAFVVVAVVFALSSAVYAEDSTTSVKVINSESLNKFRQNTADLRVQLDAKDQELRALYSFDGLDTGRVAELEEEMKGIKAKIRSVAATMNLEPCRCL